MSTPAEKDSRPRSDSGSDNASRLSAEETLQHLGSDRAVGLAASGAAARLAKHGANELTERAG